MLFFVAQDGTVSHLGQQGKTNSVFAATPILFLKVCNIAFIVVW